VGLAGANPELPVVAIADQDCLLPHFVHRLTELGVRGCLDWGCDEEEFLSALRDVRDGRSSHGREATRLLAEYHSLKTRKGIAGATRKLSPREAEVAQLLLEGENPDSVAGKLGLAETTVLTHRNRIYRKLCVHSRLELAHWFARLGPDATNTPTPRRRSPRP
jgi:two-component system invasion response regulator UvrY